MTERTDPSKKMDLRQKINSKLSKYGISANEVLGQHFLVDEQALNKMANGVSNDGVVIEVGPGLGQLTEALCTKAHKVVAVEVDPVFEGPLSDLARETPNLELVFSDFLKFDPSEIISQAKRENKHVRIISNLPYQITEPFLNKVARYRNIGMRLMVGSKFGRQAMLTDPDDPNFTELSFVSNAFFDVAELDEISKTAFDPVPRTDSIILDFTPKPDPKKLSNYTAQEVVLGQKHGTLLKNALVNILIRYSSKKALDTLTKNGARAMINQLGLSDELLNKSFSQLNNVEVRSFAASLGRLNGKI